MEKFKCQCIKCGKVIESDQHCIDLKCSECGGQMRREDRPGPGMDNATYKVGEEIFIKESTMKGQPLKRGDEFMYQGYHVKIKEKSSYAGEAGWWAKVMSLKNSPFDSHEQRRNAGKERYGSEIKA